MKKTTEDELNAWRYNFPSAIVSPTIIGDEAYAYNFMGDAYNLLYQIKNRMKLGQLKQLQDRRIFEDGTIIRAKSVFGQDFIEIDVSRRISAECVCTITLLNVPLIIQPMRYPGIIGQDKICDNDPWGIQTGKHVPLEVEGVDYIKTYYRVSQTACQNPLSWTVCDTQSLLADIGFKTKQCLPFTYTKKGVPYYMGDPNATPPIPADPKRHSIWSLWGMCQAEIIKFGADDKGTYFLWKAYTEWSPFGATDFSGIPITFSRTGLGYLRLKSYILSNDGQQESCADEKIVEVDCCHKDEKDRPLLLYWESLPPWPATCVNQPFFYYADGTWCDLPPTIPFSFILDLFIGHYVGFWVFPEKNGTCIPITWKLDGPGRLMISDDTGMAEWFPPNGPAGGPDVTMIGCNERMIVTATDRCKTSDKITVLSCCEVNTEIELLYISLAMMCGATQDITAVGACSPCTWTLSGGGSLSFGVGGPTSQFVTYHAPATNVNCADHPTLTVTDCCGKTASITFSINCGGYTGEMALGFGEITCCSDRQTGYYPDYSCYVKRSVRIRRWSCDGTLIYDCETNPGCVNETYYGAPCSQAGCAYYAGYCWTNQCGGACGGADATCGLEDCRTSAMKAAGCCPVNPFTGAPF